MTKDNDLERSAYRIVVDALSFPSACGKNLPDTSSLRETQFEQGEIDDEG